MSMELDVRHPALSARGEGEVITDREARFVALLVDRPEATVTISRYDEGEEGPGPHLHRAHADSFLVLEGTLRFGIAGESLELGAGEALLAPPASETSAPVMARIPAAFAACANSSEP